MSYEPLSPSERLTLRPCFNLALSAKPLEIKTKSAQIETKAKNRQKKAAYKDDDLL